MTNLINIIGAVSGLITILGVLFSLLGGLDDVNKKALLIILFVFSFPSYYLMTNIEPTIKFDFTKVLFVGSALSLFFVGCWIPRIFINSLKSTSKNKDLNRLLAVLLYFFLFSISYIGLFGITYFCNEFFSVIFSGKG